MYSSDREARINARTGWKTAMQLPGAKSMRYVKKLFTAFPCQDFENNQSVILNENTKGQQFMVAAIGNENKTMLVYVPVGQEVKVDFSVLTPEKL
jgi:hypothetical protein